MTVNLDAHVSIKEFNKDDTELTRVFLTNDTYFPSGEPTCRKCKGTGITYKRRRIFWKRAIGCWCKVKYVQFTCVGGGGSDGGSQ